MTPPQRPDQAVIDEEAARWFALRRAAGCETREAVLDDAVAEAEFRAWLNADSRHQETYTLMERVFDDILWALPDTGFDGNEEEG